MLRAVRLSTIPLALALAITGLVAMHGLGSHGVAGAQASLKAGAQATNPVGSDAAVSPDPAHDKHGMAAACLVLLVGLGLLLLLRGRTVLVLRRHRLVSSGRVASYVRGADPPNLHRLCVLRC